MKYHEFIEINHFQTSANSENHFWHSIQLWNERPNLINKRLIGCEILFKFRLSNVTVIDEVVNNFQQKLLNDVSEITTENISYYVSQYFKEHITINFDYVENSVVFFIKRFLPKCSSVEKTRSSIEISILDYENGQATFFNNLSSNIKIASLNQKYYSYRIKYIKQDKLEEYHSSTNKSNYILLLVDHETNNPSAENDLSILNNDLDWLKNKLVPKIVKWSEQDISIDGNGTNLNRGSLKLVDINDYCVLYQKLKDVYGKTFVKIWPENTDPLKFVYEDVAIATYLLLLWRNKKQNFVDLGCGNGLLVHILTSEGHTGLGIDVRRRKIWDLYPDGTANLEVKTVAPTSDDSCLYPDADWLIGNHSDELTPWIPVLSSISSFKCNFFLLPCCSYELNGQKYQRQNSSKSQYMDYLDHIAALCVRCGFNVAFDKLRIPSTKRICIIGESRNYSINEHHRNVKDVRDFIKLNCGASDEITDKAVVGVSTDITVFGHFKTRSNEIKVRNCTQLDKSFVNDLVLLIADKLLNSPSCPVAISESCYINKSLVKKSCWNEGSPIALSELAKSLPSSHLKRLKKECGGLQTLIKNHRYIFKVDKGHVSFRKPLDVNNDDIKKSCGLKTKRCWFFFNHPDKCPLASNDCRYSHL